MTSKLMFGAQVPRPAVRIYSSTSATAFYSTLALGVGGVVAIFLVMLPWATFLFGLPASVMILVGLYILWPVLRNVPQVVLDSEGLHIIGVPVMIRWTDIADAMANTEPSPTPYYIVKIRLQDEASYPALNSNPVSSFIGKALGFQSKVEINTARLAITSPDLAALINDYRTNSQTISDASTRSVCESSMPLSRKLMNWGMLFFSVAIFVYFILNTPLK